MESQSRTELILSDVPERPWRVGAWPEPPVRPGTRAAQIGREALRWGRRVGLPVLVTVVVIGFAVGSRLALYGGNLSGFVQFGSAFATFTHPPHGAIEGTGRSADGYDGQFFFVIARDPLLLHDSTVASLQRAPQNTSTSLLGSRNQAFRLQRVGYPLLAFLVAHTAGISIVAAMLVVNLAILLLLTGGFAYYLCRRDRSTLWALALVLLPGMVLATLRDLSGPLATATALGGLLAWSAGRRRIGVSLLVLAVLTREVMLVAAAAIALDTAWRAWHERHTPGAVRRSARTAWPAIVLPTIAFLLWHFYVEMRAGGSVGGAGIRPPFLSIIDQFRALGSVPVSMRAWEIGYVLLMVGAVVAAVRSVRREINVASVAAALFALTFLIAPFNDAWGSARDSLPMLALLLVVGLQRNERSWLAIPVAAAAMTALIPLAIPGSF